MMTDYYTDADQFPWSKDAVFHNYRAFGERPGSPPSATG